MSQEINVGQRVFVEDWSAEGGAAEAEVVGITDGKYRLKFTDRSAREDRLVEQSLLYGTAEDARLASGVSLFAMNLAVEERIPLGKAYHRLADEYRSLAQALGATQEQLSAIERNHSGK